MSRRLGNPTRHLSDNGSFLLGGSTHKKSQRSPLLAIGLVVVGAFLLIGYSYRTRSFGGSTIRKEISVEGGGDSCAAEVQRAIPILKNVYGAKMNKVLHVGPGSCSVVSKLLKDDVFEAWGIETYDLDEPDTVCKNLVDKGIVRTADIKFPLPYKPKSFSLVIISDALDYLSPKYANTTLLELTRVSKDGVVVFTGFPSHQRGKVAEQSKFGRTAKQRSPSWWQKYFLQIGLEEDEAITKQFEQACETSSYNPSCQNFHLSS